MRLPVVRALRCPVCADGLDLPDGPRGPLRCPRGHSFDQAKGGYAQLSAAPIAHPGDPAGMVAARASFLGAGHYAFVTGALASAAGRCWPGGLVVDVGAGTGTHLAGVLDALPDAWGLATDVSKPAVRLAARAHERADAVICDAWRPLPIADGAAGIVLDVFAPRPGPEFHRILRPDGALIVVTPAADHLGELVAPLGLLRVDPAKDDRVADALDGRFEVMSRTPHRRVMTLERTEIATLVRMGPSAYHIGSDDLSARVAALGARATVTAAVTVAIYRPLPLRR